MKAIGSFLIFLSFQFITFSEGQDDIRGISLDPRVIWSTKPKGSFEGGSKVYITGVNFDGKEDTLKVAYILNGVHRIPSRHHPLEILSSTKIGIETQPLSSLQMIFGDTETRTYEIALKWGQYLLGCNQLERFKCEFEYSSKYSPNMFYMTPILLAGEMSRFRVSGYDSRKLKPGNVNYFHRIDVGEGTCDITPYFLPNRTLSYHSQKLFCDIYSNAGPKNTMKFQMHTGHIRVFQVHYGYDESQYQIKVYPSIESIFPQEGGRGGGATLEITGEGFSQVKGENTVRIGGSECRITFATRSAIHCVVPPNTLGITTSTKYIGLERLIFENSTGVYNLEVDYPGLVGYSSRNLSLMTHTSGENENEKDNMMSRRTEVLRGYFTPPVTGKYKFVLNNLETTYVYIGNTTEDKEQILGQGFKHREERDWWGAHIGISAPLDLDHTKSYYLEIRHRLYTGGFFYLGFELENSTPHALNKHQVQKATIQGNLVYETHLFTIISPPRGSSGEIYKWRVFKNNNKGEKNEGLKSEGIGVRATGAEFRNALRVAIPGLSVNVVRVEYKDGEGVIIETPEDPMEDELGEITYTVELSNPHTNPHSYINEDIPPYVILTSGSALKRSNFKHYSNYEFSQALIGNYGLVLKHPSVGVMELGVFTICDTGENMQRVMEERQPILKGAVEIVRNREYNCRDRNEYYFHFLGFREDLEIMGFSQDPLVNTYTGGSNTLLEEVTQVQSYSQDLFFPFIPPEYLHLEDTGHAVEVEVKGTKSGCRYLNCKFTYLEGGPSISGAELLGDTLTLTGTGFLPTDIQWITLGDNILCEREGDTDTDALIVCKVDLGDLVGGRYMPKVKYVKGVYAVLDTVSEVVIDYEITDAYPKINLNPGGGQIIKFDGTELPKILSTEDITISIGGEYIRILDYIPSVSVTIMSPPMDYVDNPNIVEFTLNGLVKTFELNVGNTDTFPTLLSILPDTGSPVFSKDVVIKVNGDLQAQSTEDISVYFGEEEIGVFKITASETEAEIECRFVGGIKGEYEVKVIIKGLGALPSISPLKFKVEAEIHTVTPNEGSYLGGSELTLTGVGFTEFLDDMYVYFDDTECIIISATETEIKCRMVSYLPLNTQSIPTDSKSLIGQATLRLNAVARCNGECFTLKATRTPQINSVITYKDGGVHKLNITGDNLNAMVLDNVLVSIDGYLQEQGVLKAEQGEIVCSIYKTKFIKSGRIALTIVPYGDAFVLPSIDPAIPTGVFAIPFEYDELVFVEGSIHGSYIEIKGFGFSELSSQFLTISTNSGNLCPSNTINVININKIRCKSTPKTISTPEEVFLTITGEPPISCTTSDKSKCSYTTTATYNSLIKEDTLSMESTPELEVNVEFEAGIGSACDSVKLELSREVDSIRYELLDIYMCSDYISTGSCSWTPGHYIQGTYTTEIICIKDTNLHILGYKSVVVSDLTYSVTPSTQVSTYGGGGMININRVNIGNEVVSGYVCNNIGNIQRVSENEIKFIIPRISTNHTISTMNTEHIQHLLGEPFSDGSNNPNNAFDGVPGTEYISNSGGCYVGVKLPHPGVLHSARFYISNFPTWESEICKKWYTETRQRVWLEGSLDGENYDIISTLQLMLIHPEWNPFELGESEIKYIYYRVKFEEVCAVGELELYGQTVWEVEAEDVDCDLNLYFSGTHTFSNAVTYQSNITPIITDISPKLVLVREGAEVIITGTNLPTDKSTINIKLSGIPCSVMLDEDATTTQTKCALSAIGGMSQDETPKIAYATPSGLGVVAAKVEDEFFVGHRWSERVTWGAAPAPKDGDSIQVPASQCLIFDLETSPLLDLIVVEGVLIFQDAADSGSAKNILLQARRILVRGGQFLIGSDLHPYIHNTLTIRLYGYKDDLQIPIFGNKFVGIHNGNIQIHGREVTPTWTNLAASTTYKSKTIKIKGPVTGWNIGNQIIISPSESHNQAERRIITGITLPDSNNDIYIELETPLNREHIIHSRTAGNPAKTHIFDVEVGVLSRNVILEGDSSSRDTWFGGVMKVYGGNSTANIKYLEIRECGQAYQFGQYAFSFVNLDCPTCYIKHSVFHSSYNRGFALDNAYRILIEDNIAANIDGDGFSVDNVVYMGEVENTFRHNYAVDMRNAWGFLEKGMVHGNGFFMPAPPNHMIGNVVAGTQGSGIHYYTVCYYENHLWPLGTFKDNYIHATGGAGIDMIFIYGRDIPLTGPTTLLCAMPYSHDIRYRPGPRVLMENTKAFKNSANIGFFDVGNMDMNNTLLSDGRSVGFGYGVTDHLEILKIEGMIIISKQNSPQYGMCTGVWSDTTVNNITFSGFNKSMEAIRVCCGCIPHFGELYWMSWSNVTWENSPNRMRWSGHDFHTDVDGTFADWKKGNVGEVQKLATLTVYEPHLDHPDHCGRLNSSYGDPAVLICTSDIKFTPFFIYQIYPPELLYFNLTIRREPKEGFSDLGEFLADDIQHGNFSWRFMWVPWEYMTETYKMSLIVGEKYWFRWRSDLDPLKFRVQPWHRWGEGDPAAIMNLKYYDKKGTLSITTTIQDNDCNKTHEVIDMKDSLVELSTGSEEIGDYFHDEETRKLTFILGNTGEEDWMDMKSTKSLKVLGEDVEREDFYRFWSEGSNWPENKVPEAGDHVIILDVWQMICDVNHTKELERITIEGILIIPNDINTNLTLKARIIEVTTGELLIGSVDEPFVGHVEINIISGETDLGENEPFGVLTSYGIMQLIGADGRAQRISQLLEGVNIGSKLLLVDLGLDWVSGDIILLAASGFGGESEKFSVVSYNIYTGEVDLDRGVEYAHLKAAGVYNVGGYNIYIQGGVEEQWGGRVLIEDRETDELYFVSKVHFKNVYFYHMGHYHNEANVFRFYYYNYNLSDNWAVVEFCSFVDIYGGAMMAIDSSNIQFSNNIIYRPYMLGLLTERTHNIKVISNTMLSVEDEEWKKWWLLKGLTYQGGFFICPLTRFQDCQNITLTDNKLIGSETIGYATQGLPCKGWEPVSHTIYNNSAMSTTYIGWWLAGTDRSAIHCVSLSEFHMQHNLNYSVFCENKTYGMELNNGVFDTVFETIGFGDGIINHTFNGSFTGLTFIGNHEHGSVLNKKKRPELERSFGYEFDNLGVEYIYTDPANHFNMCDNTAYFYNTTFKNFHNLELTPKHNALWVSERWDTYSHEFLYPYILYKGINIENIELKDFLLWESWFQHLISFEDVNFVGDPWMLTTPLSAQTAPARNFQLVNNTSEIGDHLTNCSREVSINAYYCENEDLGMLCLNTHLEVAKHFHVWRDDGFHSTDFSRRQLVIDGDLRRVSWLISLVETSPEKNSYVLKFDSSLPPKITYFLLGQNKDKGIRLRIEYQKPLSIHLYWNEVRQDRKFFSTMESVRDPKPLIKCGDNLWNIQENILELFINGDEDFCAIRAEQVNALMLSLRVECTVEEFFSGNMQNRFMDGIAAVLLIPIHRIRIVGIYEGSTIVKSFLDQDPGITDPEAAQKELRTLKSALEEAVSKGAINIGAKILSFDIEEAFVVEEDQTNVSEEEEDSGDGDNKWIVILSVCIGVGVILIIMISIWLCKRKRKGKERKRILEEKMEQGSPHPGICLDNPSVMNLQDAKSLHNIPIPIFPSASSTPDIFTGEIERVEVKRVIESPERSTPRLPGIEDIMNTDEDFIKPEPGHHMFLAQSEYRKGGLSKNKGEVVGKGRNNPPLGLGVGVQEHKVGKVHDRDDSPEISPQREQPGAFKFQGEEK